jgi:hypothetical protein
MKVERLPIIFVLIFLLSILPVNYHHHYENWIFQVNSLTIDTVDDNPNFATRDTYQVLLNTLFISIIKTSYNLFVPRIFNCKLFTRAPPE